MNEKATVISTREEMGRMSIPSTLTRLPDGRGKAEVQLDLNKKELQGIVDKLKAVLEYGKQPGVLQHHRLLSRASPEQASTSTRTGESATQGHYTGAKINQNTQFTRILPPMPVSHLSHTRSELQPPQISQDRPDAEAWSSPSPSPPPRRLAVKAAARSPRENGQVQWKPCWRTEAEDHSNDPVLALAYAPLLDGLPGGDGHGGWLVSSSKSLLNLWECSASGGRGDPALQVMHSQMTDFSSIDLCLDRETQLLMAASRETARTSPAECVSLHSLSAEAGMFANRGRLPLPPPALRPPVATSPPEKPMVTQVETLNDFGGPLKGCVAASYKNNVVVYPTQHPAGSAVSHKALWQAHEAFITSLHRSRYSIQLYSGAADGTLNMWELRAKPKKPAANFLSPHHAVCGVEQIRDTQLLAAFEEGAVCLWDLSKPNTPLHTIPTPDGRSITCMAVGPAWFAFATEGGSIFAMDRMKLDNPSTMPLLVNEQPFEHPVRCLVWNVRTQSHLMVGSGPSISVFTHNP